MFHVQMPAYFGLVKMARMVECVQPSPCFAPPVVTRRRDAFGVEL